MDVNQSTYACFIDYNKTFDKNDHNHIIQLTVSVKVGKEYCQEINIQRGVKQISVLLSLLFWRKFEEATLGIQVLVNNFRFAD